MTGIMRRPRSVHRKEAHGSDEAATFGVLLRRLRKAAALTQEALAEKAGLNERVIRGLERDWPHRPRHDTVRLLSAALTLSGSERDTFEEAARRSAPLLATSACSQDASNALTSLTGRASLVETAAALMGRPDVRLLTLTGPGGVGKTRLGERVADVVRADYPDGVIIVTLDATLDPTLVASAVTRALGLEDFGHLNLVDVLVGALRDKNALLMLDNFEQVKAAAPLLVTLLSRCPRLKVLVTSRAALRVQGEQELAVPPLDTPPSNMATADEIAQSPAVALFVRHAQAVDSSFQLTEMNAAAVAEICRRLDGLPLAVELAAARTKLLPPGTLLSRLTSRLPLLNGGGPDRPERQRTMRDTVAWSYRLLDASVQALFRQLAVCIGGCALDDAEAICVLPSPRQTRPVAVLDCLSDLIDASLIFQSAGPNGEPRIRMLETIREYASERLAASGEAPQIRQRHAAHYLSLAESAEPETVGPGQIAALNRLEREHGNMVSALRWARESGDVVLGLRLAGALYRFWWIRGYLAEGRAWIHELLSLTRCGTVPDLLRAKVLHGAGVLAYNQRDYARATSLVGESLLLYRTHADRSGMAVALVSLAGVLRASGAESRAAMLAEEGLELSLELNDRLTVAFALTILGRIVRHRGEDEPASALYERSLGLYRAGSDKRGIAYALANLALISRERGQWERAAALDEEALTLYEDLGDKGGRGGVLLTMGDMARRCGDETGATRLHEESVAMYREVGDRNGIARARERLASSMEADSHLQQSPPERRRPGGVRD